MKLILKLFLCCCCCFSFFRIGLHWFPLCRKEGRTHPRSRVQWSAPGKSARRGGHFILLCMWLCRAWLLGILRPWITRSQSPSSVSQPGLGLDLGGSGQEAVPEPQPLQGSQTHGHQAAARRPGLALPTVAHKFASERPQSVRQIEGLVYKVCMLFPARPADILGQIRLGGGGGGGSTIRGK